MSQHAEDSAADSATLEAWRRMPADVERAVAGLSESELDLRDGADTLSIREIVHHLVESNLVASNIVIAALAKSGSVFDWSWVTPGGTWFERLGYSRVPVAPALAALRAICEHLAAVVGASADGLSREVQLLDAPGAKLYPRSVAGVLRQEVDHAREHLGEVARTREAHGV